MKLGVLVYIERDEHILMIHRQKKDEHLGLWLAPGGKLEAHEAPLEAAVREVKEETGLDIAQLILKGVLTFPDLGDSPFGDEWHVFVFYTSVAEGALLAVSPEGPLAWIPRQQLLALPMWEGDRLFTPKIFQEGCFQAKLLYRHADLISTIFWDPLPKPS